jgi:predicted SprT family Zn-dependent metalloprotease
MTINQALTLASKLMKNHPELKTWRVSTNNRKGSFGVCKHTSKIIELSSLLLPAMTDNAIKDTIIHEISHALTPGHHHDNIWKHKCIELGGNGQRCGGVDKYENGEEGRQIVMQKLAKYTLTCPVCGTNYHMNRKTSGDRSCSKHGRGYNVMYKLSVTQNY